jgi:hypothetical protein
MASRMLVISFVIAAALVAVVLIVNAYGKEEERE